MTDTKPEVLGNLAESREAVLFWWGKYMTLKIEGEKVYKDQIAKLKYDLNKAQKALSSKVWFSAIIITVAIVIFTVVAVDIKYECWQYIGAG